MSKILEQIADRFRMWAWPAVAACLLVFLDRPEQVAVLMYKGIMISVAAWLGYWVDRNLFGRLVENERSYTRALIVAAVIIGFSLGL